MDWYALGHAMWLAAAGRLRLLFDPLLADLHHGGVFTVFPPREVHAEALRADFVLVSHRHPDHFDVASLRRLAGLDPDTVLVTPDPLVVEVGRALGFRCVRELSAGQRVELDGCVLCTTPSTEPDEWGAALADDRVMVWNQVDTTFASPASVAAVCSALCDAPGGHAGPIDLALVRWQPAIEVAGQLAESPGFPVSLYERWLDEHAAMEARAVVPASAGVAHAGPYTGMNRAVYPVTEAMFLRDVAERCPRTRAMPYVAGGRYRVTGDGVELDPRGGDRLVTVDRDALDPRAFRPFEGLGPVVDPNPDGLDVEGVRTAVERWVEGPLVEALRSRGASPSRAVLEVVLAEGDPLTWRLQSASGGFAARRDDDPDWSVRCVVAGSLLASVIEGRRHWGDLLLGGCLRGCRRGLRARGELSPLFVYYALPYDESVRRAVRWALATDASQKI